jgi:cbb3-type cytochrome oxidase subunit 3
MYLYRKENKGAIDSASNYLTVLIIVVPLTIIATVINVIFMPEDGWDIHLDKGIRYIIVVPIFFGLSYFIKRIYVNRINNLDIETLSKILKFNLFTLWLFIVALALMTFLLPRII